MYRTLITVRTVHVRTYRHFCEFSIYISRPQNHSFSLSKYGCKMNEIPSIPYTNLERTSAHMCRHREKKAAERPAHCTVRTNRRYFDDEDFAAAISGILPSSNSCAEKENVAMKWENKSGRPTDDSQLLCRAPFPCETPCSRQMRRYLRGAQAWNSEPNLRSLRFEDCGSKDKPNASTRHDASVDSSAVDEMLTQEDARVMPGNGFIPKAVHCSHMRLPRHISKLLHASLIADLNDRHDFQVGKIGTAPASDVIIPDDSACRAKSNDKV